MIELEIPSAPLDHDGDDRERSDWLAEVARLAHERWGKQIPSRFAAASITNDQVRQWAQALVTEAVQNPRQRVHPAIRRGRSLLLLGPTGTGKTYQAYGVVQQLATTGLLAGWRFKTAPDLYAQLRPRSGVDAEKQFQDIAGAPLLVVDDLGAAKTSEWVEEINYRLVNTRYERELPTVITSNVVPRKLGEALGDRVASRLIEMADTVVLEGADRRRAPAA